MQLNRLLQYAMFSTHTIKMSFKLFEVNLSSPQSKWGAVFCTTKCRQNLTILIHLLSVNCFHL